MECSSVSDSGTGGGGEALLTGTSVCEEAEALAGWLTSTPQPPRRPLHQLNTASPRPPLTPYRYHGCKAIPEEREDQENIDPLGRRVQQDSSASAKSSGMSPENTTHTGSGSSPFAYPLIWEASHASGSSPSEGKRSQPAGDAAGAWRSPVSHYRDQRNMLGTASEGEAVKAGTEGRESQQQQQQQEGSGSGKVRNRSGSGNDSYSTKVPQVTPSKATHTQILTNTVFLTPSSSMHCTRPGEGRGGQTPKQQRMALSASHHVNPFEVGAESLYLSAVSPSLFQQVVSPSQKVDANFRWSIDQMAALQPVNIETSPFMQVEALVDPDYERRAQDAIDRFFTSHQSVIPSPWTGSNKSMSVVKKMCVQPSQASPSVAPARTQTVWCQTELSLPPVLPPALEEALRPFCTFTQNQGWQQGPGEGDEAASLNNTTLRRKLLFGHEDLTTNTPSLGGSEPSSPSPSPSPSASYSFHGDGRSPGPAAHRHQDEAHQEEEEVEENVLVWCTAVVGPGLSEGGQEGATLMRHSPPTPPSLGASITTTSVTQATPRPGTLLPPYTAGTELLTSPDVSPIHHHQYTTSLEASHTPASGNPSLDASGYLEYPHTRCTYLSPSDTPPASTCSSSHTPPLSGSEDEWRRSPRKKHSFTPPHSSPRPHGSFVEVVESEVHMGTQEEEEEEEEHMPSDHREVEKPVYGSGSFSSHYSHEDRKPKSTATSSPTTELRCSLNSGHFSSSPIRDISQSSLEVESPAKRFSASPPLSPILRRPLLFPTQPCDRLHSMPLIKAMETSMMEESEEVGVPTTTTTTTTMLPPCSSLCDMEMDSQPSVESHLGEEAASQDTGYQTVSSLLTSNFSCTTFPPDLPHALPMVETGSRATQQQQLPSTATSKEFRP